MNKIVFLTSIEAEALGRQLLGAAEQDRYARIAIDADQVKVKVGESVWSIGYGQAQ